MCVSMILFWPHAAIVTQTTPINLGVSNCDAVLFNSYFQSQTLHHRFYDTASPKVLSRMSHTIQAYLLKPVGSDWRVSKDHWHLYTAHVGASQNTLISSRLCWFSITETPHNLISIRQQLSIKMLNKPNVHAFLGEKQYLDLVSGKD